MCALMTNDAIKIADKCVQNKISNVKFWGGKIAGY